MAGRPGQRESSPPLPEPRTSGTARATPPLGSTELSVPSISLPKGGGAIRGIGEKFAANPVTGTSSLTIPIATSPGRSGFGPEISLQYDSGNGNGPFGLGWSLSLPAITRKTDKGLPRYRDAEESDVFILSGAEDLVPEFEKDAEGNWVLQNGELVVHDKLRTVANVTYRVRRYCPRIEGLFARIERWSDVKDPANTFWRSISRDNITTWYGRTSESRIFDPVDPSRIFSWFISSSYEDRGNAIVYEYQRESSDGVDTALARERNRTTEVRETNCYLKRIKYGNRKPNRDSDWKATDPSELSEWMFEVVFDYGEGHYSEQAPDAEERVLVQASLGVSPDARGPVRDDPFSSYRSGFEVRTYRLCRRVLMFHHFPDELGTPDYLVRSTEFTFSELPIASFITGVVQSGYTRRSDGTYLKKSLPPLELGYTQAVINSEVHTVDPASLENLPNGLDGGRYRWLDLDGEGLSGVLTEQAEGWLYKRNLSPLPEAEGGSGIPETPLAGGAPGTLEARFAPAVLLPRRPSLAPAAASRHEFLDLAGDGQVDVVRLEPPVAGFFERAEVAGWQNFVPFKTLPNITWDDPNLRFVDLTGDGHADVLITEQGVLTWYPSLGEEGFGPAESVRQALDEEKGPRLVFADGTESIYLADLSGDGLTDLARIRNGEVCYWPNLGYGRFGPKVTMDSAPLFDSPDLFDQQRVRLGDIDGSGTTDIFYLGRDAVTIWRNESGNAWSAPDRLTEFPRTDNQSSVVAVDLLGNGTACLVWSSPLPAEAGQPMRYIDLMGGQKPHLLVSVENNLGAETKVQYVPTTKFYLADKAEGRPWITRLPFPVHVVERIETYDRISRSRFVTRHAYHHGYFDGEEREFRGFGRVDQWDTEEIGTVGPEDHGSQHTNWDAASFVPPALTRTWFHTGAYLEGKTFSRQFENEYYREGDPSLGRGELGEAELKELLLEDTELPDEEFTTEEIREACRSLKGAVLRQEIYALDGTEESDRPYSVSERNYTIKRLQPRDEQRHGVFFTHERETVDFHYERKLFKVAGGKLMPPGDPVPAEARTAADPRVTHGLMLEVDEFGNVLQSIAIAYGRRFKDPSLTPEDQERQQQTLVTLTENRFTNPIPDPGASLAVPDDLRAPLPCETRTFELELELPPGQEGLTSLVSFETLRDLVLDADFSTGKWDLPYEDLNHTQATGAHAYRRPIEHARTLYRKNDLTGPLPLGTVESLALPYETYQLAFTPGLLDRVYVRGEGQGAETLLPDPQKVLGSTAGDGGGYVDVEGDGHWWVPSGRVFHAVDADAANPAATAAQELGEAHTHFFLPRKATDPFGESSTVDYDTDSSGASYDLLVTRTQDALANTITAASDYRVLQPKLVTDANGNRAAAAFDALGMVVATAVMGKETESLGDLLEDFDPDPPLPDLQAFVVDPAAQPAALLGKATSRIVYDLDRYPRAAQPPFAATLARETHFHDPGGELTRIQVSFSYSDGFGREVQKKIQAEGGDAPQRQADVLLPTGDIRPGDLVLDGEGNVVEAPTPRRWVGSGRTVFNNKGKPVKQYEPFFSATHLFEPEPEMTDSGVTPILFYDPVERVVATLHPNHTWEKVVFDPWRQETWDVNDTVLLADPEADADVGQLFRRLPDSDYLPTWHALRTDPAHAAAATEAWPDPETREEERRAAEKVAVHAGTPTVAHADSLGRSFLTVAHNKFKYSNSPESDPPTEELYNTRVVFDIEGNERKVIDAKGRLIMTYDYDMLGNRIHQASMEAGARWMLHDMTGRPIRAWDSRDHALRTSYDEGRRPVGSYLREGSAPWLLVGRTVYGESQQNPEANNLRGQVVEVSDQAGLVVSDEYDFKGNLLRSSRRLAADYKGTLDWSATVPLEPETYTTRTRFDALARPIQQVAPHSDQPGAKINVIQPVYNEANLLEELHVWLDQAAEPGETLDPDSADLHSVTDIDYDAKGQRTLIDYGNGVRTTYSYDPLTCRLVRLLSRRDAAAFQDDCPDPAPAEWPGCQVQNLHYTYDPAGNITSIRDKAQQTIFFRNRRVDPSNQYTYDGIYRLIEATGREHLGQVGGSPIPHSYNDSPRAGLAWSASDGRAMGRYLERYSYDEVGNHKEMRHIGSDPANPGWTRTYEYAEPSQLEPGKAGNRLTSTLVGNTTYVYSANGDGYDPHGSMLRMEHLQVMEWDFRDQLAVTQRQKVDEQDAEGIQRHGERTHYVYDAAGERRRKVTRLANGALKDERIYLGGFELYRDYSGTDAGLVRETLHLMDDQGRIALVETRTQGNDGSPSQLIRYQLGNHLGSVSLELSDAAGIISHEEHTPYGSTSHQAATKDLRAAAKRYRYTGKERDEETGLSHHGARYYAAWLGRWTATDPRYLRDGPNLYSYVGQNPALFVDPTGENTAQPNRLRGTQAADRLAEFFKLSNRDVVTEVTVRGGKGGSRIDLIVNRGERAIESKLIDVSRKEFRKGTQLDQAKIERHFRREFQSQLTKHERALAQVKKMPMQLDAVPLKEDIVIQLDNASDSDLAVFRSAYRRVFRGSHGGNVVRADVLAEKLQLLREKALVRAVQTGLRALHKNNRLGKLAAKGVGVVAPGVGLWFAFDSFKRGENLEGVLDLAGEIPHPVGAILDTSRMVFELEKLKLDALFEMHGELQNRRIIEDVQRHQERLRQKREYEHERKQHQFNVEEFFRRHKDTPLSGLVS